MTTRSGVKVRLDKSDWWKIGGCVTFLAFTLFGAWYAHDQLLSQLVHDSAIIIRQNSELRADLRKIEERANILESRVSTIEGILKRENEGTR